MPLPHTGMDHSHAITLDDLCNKLILILVGANMGPWVGLSATGLYLAHQFFITDNPDFSRKKFIAEATMSAIIGWCVYAIIHGMGGASELAAGCAVVIGSTGNKGYGLLLARAEKQLNGNDNPPQNHQ